MAELTVEVLVMALSGRPMRIPALIRDRITATIS
jgi:acyl-CoA thioesterase FadM